MTTDGGLRKIFKDHLPHFDWQSVETWSTGQGVPDANYCVSGVEGWVEMKLTEAWAVNISPEQIAWAERRLRHGGNVFLAVRRKHSGGARKGMPGDELWFYSGHSIRIVSDYGLEGKVPLLLREGGPKKWDWERIGELLIEGL